MGWRRATGLDRLFAPIINSVKHVLETAEDDHGLPSWVLLRLRWSVAKVRMVYSDYGYARLLFSRREERWNPDNPITYNEKLWFLKLSKRDPLLTECSDKHAVRHYVERCGLADILKTEYGSFARSSDIDFSTLPSPCYLKCSHGSGLNWIYRQPVSSTRLRRKMREFDYLLKQNTYILSREWNYKEIRPTIIAEEVLETSDGEDIPELQFFCFHGKVRFVMYNLGLADRTGKHKRATRWVLDSEFRVLNVRTSMESGAFLPERPSNFGEMIRCAETLASPFEHVRVDLFNVHGRIVFNELTFYSGGGFVKLEPIEWQNEIGSYLDVSHLRIATDAYDANPLRFRRSKRPSLAPKDC